MPQDHLFDPGPKRASQWKNHPDKWVKRPGIVYHTSRENALPRIDRGPNIDPGYGNSTGMHFGSKLAAYDRAGSADSRQLIHTARLNAPKTERMSDERANYGEKADKAVREGKIVPYKNTFEDEGGTSYRAKPESVRTWSEDIQADPNAHPALKHLADRGYNPTLNKYEIHSPTAEVDKIFNGPPAKQLFEADLKDRGKSIAHGSEDEMFAKSKDARDADRYLGVQRNNVNAHQGTDDIVKAAKPRMRPSRRDSGSTESKDSLLLKAVSSHFHDFK